ncbi:pseudouridine synthase, RluA family [Thermocrinis albus DSM 14484]|uniref:Pseudouridine synthase n=1 Tax=Thermocrinis albus (strain DSM 14484 / JCM 11386 / HI 11/12) TaxID=638303 RepID=D3SNM8_THEAH|nr:RluA family pseudouridine synthase [Thermocrinis albus]ADC88765.1 pseudouridine synthase, RluA family [Thermocrinis albus DSM 14484]
MCPERTEEILEFRVEEHQAGKRLDQFLAEAYPDFSRSYIKELVEGGYVLVDGQVVYKPSRKVKGGEVVVLCVPKVEPLSLPAEDIPLEILYEDDDLAVVVKPCGLVVHPSPGYTSGTLVNALLFRWRDLPTVGEWYRPGIVHRLDRNTMGVMVVAKRELAHRRLAEQFEKRKVLKVYRALVKGLVERDEGTLSMPLARDPRHRKRFTVSEKGRDAITHYKVLKRYRSLSVSLLEIRIYTGRTHQIRVHMAGIGHPVLGDRIYGYVPSSLPQEINEAMGECHMLVSYRLGFYHPVSGQWMEFSKEDIQPFSDVLSLIEKLEKERS